MGAHKVVKAANSRPQLDLLRAVGYELQVPLTHILGVSEMLRAGSFDEEAVPEQLARLEISSQRMLRLIESLLFAGQVETDQMRLQIGPINVASVVHDVVQQSRELAKRYDIELEVAFTGELQPADVDAAALQHSLFTMLDMIIRSSSSNRISIIVHHQEGDIMMTVRDEGEHLPSGSIEKVLQRLGSVQPSKKLSATSGVALYVCSTLLGAMQGALQMQQVKGRRTVSLLVPRSKQLELPL